MIMNFKKLLWTVAILVFTLHLGAAEIRHTGTYDGYGVCEVVGEIEQSDAAKLVILAPKCRQLSVSSPGGSVNAALALGRVIRANALNVIIDEEDRCDSSCAFLFVAGVNRTLIGTATIGIHRPYLASGALSRDETKRKYDLLERNVSSYLHDMGLDDRLYRQMLLIPPHKLLQLTAPELEALGVGRSDPVHSEYIDNKKAGAQGFSRQQWLTMKARASGTCGDLGRDPPPGRTHNQVGDCWRKEFPEFFMRVR